MLGPRLSALSALKSVRHGCPPRGFSTCLVRSYSANAEPKSNASPVWDEEARERFTVALGGSKNSGDSSHQDVHPIPPRMMGNANRTSRVSSSERVSPAPATPTAATPDDKATKRASPRERFEQKRADMRGKKAPYQPQRGNSPQSRQLESGNRRSNAEPDDKEFGLRRGDSEGSLASESVYRRRMKAKAVAAQHANFLQVHGKTISFLEQSEKEADKLLAKQHRTALKSMEEQLEKVLASLQQDMPGNEFERFKSNLICEKGNRKERVSQRAAEGKPAFIPRQQATLGKSASVRGFNPEAWKVSNSRRWALMAKQQAGRAAALAELDGATDEAKTAAQVLATTAEIAMKDFQQLREDYKDILSPSDLRDIEISDEEGYGSNFTGADVDEAMANSGRQTFKRDGRFVSEVFGELAASDVPVKPIKPPREGKVARLSNQLQRVLFSPGVHYLRDPRTGVWNFASELSKIPTPDEFNFDSIPEYITASKDPELANLGQTEGVKYIGSTSTVTQSFSQIWFALNGGHGVDIEKHTQPYATQGTAYTAGAQLPASIVLWPQANGRYAVDSDKRVQTDDNILSQYGNILEKVLTTDPTEWWKSLKDAPEEVVAKSKPKGREAYAYSRGGSVLMRSQLDCQDNRLPGSGTFDIKTRACMPIRHDRANWVKHSAYDISETLGEFATFERETFDLSRSGMLKYCFQARIGDMDGIFIAYHNTARCFGFEYMPRSELDKRLFGSVDVADQVFALCVGFFERIMDLATGLFPDTAISVTLFQPDPPMSAFEKAKRSLSRDANDLLVVVQPMEWNGEGDIPTRAIKLQMIHNVDGRDVHPGHGIKFFAEDAEERIKQKWTVRYNIAMTPNTDEGYVDARAIRANALQRLLAMTSLALPEGKTRQDMLDEGGLVVGKSESAADEGDKEGETSGIESLSFAKTNWVWPSAKIRELRKSSAQAGEAYERRAATWNDVVQDMKSTDPEPETKPEQYKIEDHDFQPIQRREFAAPADDEAQAEASDVKAAVDAETAQFVEESSAQEAMAAKEAGSAGEPPAHRSAPRWSPSPVELAAQKSSRDPPPHIVRE